MVANMAVTVILRVRTEVFIRDAPFFQLAVLENKKPALSKARAQMAKIDTEMIRRLFRAEPRDCARHLFLSSGLYRRFRNRTGSTAFTGRGLVAWHPSPPVGNLTPPRNRLYISLHIIHANKVFVNPFTKILFG